MAMGLLRRQVDAQQNTWQIDSAGVWAQSGLPPSEFGRVVLGRRGIDISDHRSQPVTRDLLAAYRLSLVMENHHKAVLKSEFPAYSARIYLLSEMVGKSHDILDPYGFALPDYERTAQEIEGILQDGFHLIQYLSDGKPTPHASA